MESILLDIFEEHLDEAAFLWTQWEQALESPDFTLEETATVEARLRAHLDGLVVGEAAVAEALLKPSLESEDPSILFATAFALLDGAERIQPSDILALLLPRASNLHAPIQRALELNEREELTEALEPLLKESTPEHLALALEVLAFHHVTPKDAAVHVLLQHEEERLLVATLRCIQPLPRHLLRGHLPRLLADPRPAVRDAAMVAGLISGARVAWERCLDTTGRHAAPSRQQLLLLGLSGESLGTERLLNLLEVAELRADVFWALGFSGQFAAAEACLEWLEHPVLAPLAGEAFSAITGLSLRDDYLLEKQEESAQEPLPLEEEDLDADLTPRPEESLPIPHPKAVGTWWHENRGNFTPGQRYLRGRSFSMEALLAELSQGPMRRRHAHALELALRSQGACRLQTRALTRRQGTGTGPASTHRSTALRAPFVRHTGRRVRATMWALENHTPFAAERTWVIDKDGAKRWVVAVKGTYDILEDQRTRLAEEQSEPLLLPQYRGEQGSSSLLHEVDLTAPKTSTDVLLNALAHAPGGKPTTTVDVSFQLGPLQKHLRVFGDRQWKRGLPGLLGMTPPRPFLTMPLSYERAFGGRDSRADDPSEHRLHSSNPVGTGFVTRAAHAEEMALPNVEDPRQLISSWKDRPHAAGFGAIASYWSPRLELAGTYDAHWKKTRFPLLPSDFDERFHQCAPADQQVPGFLTGGERVELVNLSRWPRLRFALPKVWLVFKTFFGRRSVEHRARLHTVILEPEVPRVILVWHTSLSCHHDSDKLDVTVIDQKEYLSRGGLA